ncbi:hypothetical protein ECB94_27280 (plasmid) [Vibrio mediterranei]|uniref:Uncharacterized protein n=1 Tax=Vibrio mediterranei TaxID=689 RepID=A0A3G4VLE8_9VIBR|nr:hypothetical protein ECB94_27280 [Vibrio mediterranei]
MKFKLERYWNNVEIYLAYSEKLNCLKVGYSRDPQENINRFNELMMSVAGDFSIVYSFRLNRRIAKLVVRDFKNTFSEHRLCFDTAESLLWRTHYHVFSIELESSIGSLESTLFKYLNQVDVEV